MSSGFMDDSEVSPGISLSGHMGTGVVGSIILPFGPGAET